MKYRVTYRSVVGYDARITQYKYFDTHEEALEFINNNYFIMVLKVEEV